MASGKLFGAFAIWVGAALGQAIPIPGSLTLNATNSSGVSFTFAGTLTQAATISIVVSGLACEQPSATYCTNAAGVIVVPGSSGTGATSTFSGTFAGTTANWNFGALLMVIPGAGAAQIFPATTINGLGSSSPPVTIALPASGVTLSALGFPNFSLTNPTITFVTADTAYGDNSGSFTIGSGNPTGVAPAPSTLYLAVLGMMAISLMLLSRRGWRRALAPRG